LERPELDVATLAAYVSVGAEPGTQPLLAALQERGRTVLLPVQVSGGGLDWAAFTGVADLRPGPRGIPEPSGPSLGAGALARAEAVLVPGLLADRAGNRLGRGAGCYDRALRHRRPGVPIVVLLYPGELVDELPAEPHDIPVDAALTPDGWVRLD